MIALHGTKKKEQADDRDQDRAARQAEARSAFCTEPYIAAWISATTMTTMTTAVRTLPGTMAPCFYETVLAPGELLTAVELPARPNAPASPSCA